MKVGRFRTLAVSCVTALALAPSAAAHAHPSHSGDRHTVRRSCVEGTRHSSTSLGSKESARQTDGTTQTYTLTSGGRTRSYRLHLPAHYSSHRAAWPLVLAFHGRGSTAAELEGYSKLSTLPAVVVYPDGVPGSTTDARQAWQGAPYARTGVDDVAFTRDLLTRVRAQACVDPGRIYATGKSNGGGFAALLACRMPKQFAAVAVVAPALYPGTRKGCASGPPVPTLEIHGTGDSTIPYLGDADRGLPSIRQWVADVADRNGCARKVRSHRVSDEVTRYDYRHCDADVSHIAVTGGGHVWPGAESYSGGGYVTHDIEAQQEIGRFFAAHHSRRGHTS